jgi:hypothetical protein
MTGVRTISVCSVVVVSSAFSMLFLGGGVGVVVIGLLIYCVLFIS